LTVTAAIGVTNAGGFRGFGVNGLSYADAAIESSQAEDGAAWSSREFLVIAVLDQVARRK